MGFEQGWNLAQFVQGEMVLVEPLGRLNQLSQIVLDNTAFLPRYKVNGLGSISAEADFGDEFSIDLLPAHWLNEIQQSKQVFRCMFKTVIYPGRLKYGYQPSSEQFGISFPSDSSYYQQWSSSVDVAAFIPLVFPGEPSEYDSGVPQQGVDIASTDTRLGAVCKDSSTLSFTFLQEPRKPSEIYWYSLVGYGPVGMRNMGQMVYQALGVWYLRIRTS